MKEKNYSQSSLEFMSCNVTTLVYHLLQISSIFKFFILMKIYLLCINGLKIINLFDPVTLCEPRNYEIFRESNKNHKSTFRHKCGTSSGFIDY